MPNSHKAYANLSFSEVYENALTQYHSGYGIIVTECAIKGLLNSSMFASKIWDLTNSFAIQLAKDRLKLDLDTLAKFNLSVYDNIEWLKTNQNDLLLKQLGKVIGEKLKQPPMSVTDTSNINNELSTIYQGIENQIAAQLKSEDYSHMVITAQSAKHATVNAIQNINKFIQIESVSSKLLELIKSSSVPEHIKEETIDLIETSVEQIKNGQPKKTIIKSLGEKLNSLSTIISTTASTANSSNDIINCSKQFWNLVKPSILSN